jgi:hypothetical protein
MASRLLQHELRGLDWIDVDSSNLEQVAFVPSFGRLWIAFGGPGKPRTVYVYFDVPQDVYDGLLAASSKGSYHAARIKNRFGYERIL